MRKLLHRILDRLTGGWIYKTCPMCGGPFERVLYMGLPGKLCQDEVCRCLVGPACWTSAIYFNGLFTLYEKGHYWRALWNWLTGNTYE